MQWTVSDYRHSNHPPIVEVNGQGGTSPIMIDTAVGQPITLDASASRDPDADKLTYHWFHYAEAGSTGTPLAAVTLSGADTAKAVVTPTAACRPQWLPRPGSCSGNGSAHIVLAVTDSGSPRLTSYRRIILNVAK